MASHWHPIFLTTELSPGVWVMKAAHEVEGFGRIELRRGSGTVRYKVIHGGEVIGWSTFLQVACEQLFLEERRRRDAVYSGPPNGHLSAAMR